MLQYIPNNIITTVKSLLKFLSLELAVFFEISTRILQTINYVF